MTTKQVKIASCWSGGKDSCLACFKTIQNGHRVISLINLVSKDSGRVSFHGLNKKLIKLQAQAINIPLLQKEISSEKDEIKFKSEAKNLVKKLTDKNIKGLVFGYTDPHDKQRAFAQRLCSELDLELIEPLCGKNPKEVLKEFIELGFKAVIVKLDSRILDKRWLGHLIDKDFFKYLEEKVKRGDFINFCGDFGEFHTFVIDGPMFKKRIELLETKKVKRGNYWVLDIKKY